MRPGWTTVSLGEVASFIRGVTFKPNDVTDGDGPDDVWCMRTTNVQDTLRLDDVWSIGRSHVRRDEQFLRAGDTLVSSANSWYAVGRACWVPSLERPATFGGFVSVLRPTSEHVDPRFLNLWFRSTRTQTIIRGFGRQTTNISNLDLKRTSALPLAMPPIDEQRRIVAILDKMNHLRAKRRATLERGGALVQASLAKSLQGARSVPMGSFVAEFRYGTSAKSGPTGLPALRIPNVVGGSLDLTEVKTVRVDEATRQRLTLDDGDLLFVRTNGNPDNVGRSAVFRRAEMEASGFDSSATIYASYLIRARLSDDTDPLFVQAFLSSSEGRRRLRAKAKTSAGQYNINIEGLGSTVVDLPSIDQQRDVAAEIRQVEHLRASARRHLAELDALFASLQSRAFTGELDVSKIVLPAGA